MEGFHTEADDDYCSLLADSFVAVILTFQRSVGCSTLIYKQSKCISVIFSDFSIFKRIARLGIRYTSIIAKVLGCSQKLWKS